MEKLPFIAFAILLLAAPAQAEGERRIFDGSEYVAVTSSYFVNFGRDLVEGTEDDVTSFRVVVRSRTSFGEPYEFVPMADDLFEQFLHHATAGTTIASVELYHEENDDWDAPSVLERVAYRFERDSWTRESHPEIPILDSLAFPMTPVREIRLSSGETVSVLPISRGHMPIGFMLREDREALFLRVVVDRSFEELASGDPILGLIWDEVLHDILVEQGDNYVSVILYSDIPETRFDAWRSLRIAWPQAEDGSWPELDWVIGAVPEIGPSGFAINHWY